MWLFYPSFFSRRFITVSDVIKVVKSDDLVHITYQIIPTVRVNPGLNERQHTQQSIRAISEFAQMFHLTRGCLFDS